MDTGTTLISDLALLFLAGLLLILLATSFDGTAERGAPPGQGRWPASKRRRGR